MSDINALYYRMTAIAEGGVGYVQPVPGEGVHASIFFLFFFLPLGLGRQAWTVASSKYLE
jgi:hypothetical protein